jgi:prepilin-type N-terminal cleavage/methylation domain-containing protein
MNRKNGFTLIELLVVIAIIGVLTGLVTFNFQQARVRARDVQRKSELGVIRDALEMYKNDRIPQTYPTADNIYEDDGLRIFLVSDYIKNEMPIDPVEKASPDGWQDYSYDGSGLTYTLQACLENASDPDKKIGSLCGAGNRGVIYEITP